MGVPATELLRVPKADDAAGWASFHAKLGVPADAKEYTFEGLKAADGADLPEDFLNQVRVTAKALNLPKAQAPALAQAMLKREADAAAAGGADLAAKLANEQAELARSWGAAAAQNKVIAQRAAQALGVEPETVAALEKQVGYAKVMEMFRQIGARIGEDSFVPAGPGGGKAIMTREMAVARRSELQADPVWREAYLKGGVQSAQFREMMNLNTIIAGGDDTATSRSI